MIFFFFLPSTNKTMVANAFSGRFLHTKYKRLDSTWIKCVPINANHKLSEWHFQSWSWEHSCLNVWIPLALISVLLVQRSENRKEFLFFSFFHSLSPKELKKGSNCVDQDAYFSFFLPTRVNSVPQRCPLLSGDATGGPKQIFLRPVPLAWCHF